MENNENLNNRVNRNNVQEEKKNNNKTIGIVVLVISLLLLCFAGYKLFIEKFETDKHKNDNTQEGENNQKEDNDEEDQEKYRAIDFNEVASGNKELVYFEYEFVADELPRKLEYTGSTGENYNIVLSNDGKVIIKKEIVKITH